jgi:cyanophycin synthetase
MNIFEFKKFKVLIDFAHNASGYAGVEDYLQSVQATKKIGIIAGVGDRRDEDIKECAKLQDACLIILSYDKKTLKR